MRTFWDGEIILSGAITTGRSIRAAEVLGADYVYMGTRFIPTEESMAVVPYKQMIVEAGADDIVCSDAITGVKANWLRQSLAQAGYDPQNMPQAGEIDLAKAADDRKRWRDIWAAGQGVGAINSIQSVADVVKKLHQDYQSTKQNNG